MELDLKNKASPLRQSVEELSVEIRFSWDFVTLHTINHRSRAYLHAVSACKLVIKVYICLAQTWRQLVELGFQQEEVLFCERLCAGDIRERLDQDEDGQLLLYLNSAIEKSILF
jgi:hypothetical protein